MLASGFRHHSRNIDCFLPLVAYIVPVRELVRREDVSRSVPAQFFQALCLKYNGISSNMDLPSNSGMPSGAMEVAFIIGWVSWMPLRSTT